MLAFLLHLKFQDLNTGESFFTPKNSLNVITSFVCDHIVLFIKLHETFNLYSTEKDNYHDSFSETILLFFANNFEVTCILIASTKVLKENFLSYDFYTFKPFLYTIYLKTRYEGS